MEKYKYFFRNENLDFTTKVLFLLSFIMLLPITMVLFFRDEAVYIVYFVYPALINLFIAFAFLFIKRKFIKNNYKIFGRNQELVVVFCIWIFSFLIGSLPFILSGKLGIVQGIFESVSGWTTTGLSVVDVEQTPNIFLFYRSLMQFCGGLGFVLLMLLFTSGGNAMKLFFAEGHDDKLEANLKDNVRMIVKIYLFVIFSGFFLYMVFGMNWFDALIHAMSAVSTGGFSTKYESIGYFNNLYIEIVTIILMLIGATSFSVLFVIIKKDFKELNKLGEIKFFIFLILFSILLNTFLGLSTNFESFKQGLRISSFNIISAFSTTGFSTVDVSYWNASMIYIMIILMLIGGSSGSTSGGLKLTRVYIMLKHFFFGIKAKFFPERAVNETYFRKPYEKIYLTPTYVSQVYRFYFVYLLIFIIGSFMLTIATDNISLSMFEFVAALSTVGISKGLIDASSSNYILIVNIFGMILGRLEIFLVFVSIVAIIKKPVDLIKID